MTSERAAKAAEAPGQDLAGLGERFTALFIDWVACLVFTYLIGWIGGVQGEVGGVNLVTPALFAVYYTFSMTVGSQTLGMAVMRIACVSSTTGDRLGLWRALVRALLLSIVLPALTSLFDPYYRGLHDKAAGSVMLKAPKRSR